MPKFLLILLLPFSWLYGLVILLRSILYKHGILTRTQFNFPIICVGNLAVGGTGKTPHIEWLISQLSPELKIGVLSRGYKRKTSGYVLAKQTSSPYDIGDEPYQIKQKFNQVALAVSENRVLGVPQLLGDRPDVQVILMDDGFQHLSIKAGFNIILTDFNRPFFNDKLLPAGLLREPVNGAARADIIIVTKCPKDITESQQQQVINAIKPQAHQSVYFTYITYFTPIAITQAARALVKPPVNQLCVALSGLAKAEHFLNHINQQYKQVTPLTFADHVTYNTEKIQALAQSVALKENTWVATTEKDAVKLGAADIIEHINHIPIWYFPIGVEFINQQHQSFLAQLKHYITTETDLNNNTF